jgi:hypothetical protein
MLKDKTMKKNQLHEKYLKKNKGERNINKRDINFQLEG